MTLYQLKGSELSRVKSSRKLIKENGRTEYVFAFSKNTKWKKSNVVLFDLTGCQFGRSIHGYSCYRNRTRQLLCLSPVRVDALFCVRSNSTWISIIKIIWCYFRVAKYDSPRTRNGGKLKYNFVYLTILYFFLLFWPNLL